MQAQSYKPMIVARQGRAHNSVWSKNFILSMISTTNSLEINLRYAFVFVIDLLTQQVLDLKSQSLVEIATFSVIWILGIVLRCHVFGHIVTSDCRGGGGGGGGNSIVIITINARITRRAGRIDIITGGPSITVVFGVGSAS